MIQLRSLQNVVDYQCLLLLLELVMRISSTWSSWMISISLRSIVRFPLKSGILCNLYHSRISTMMLRKWVQQYWITYHNNSWGIWIYITSNPDPMSQCIWVRCIRHPDYWIIINIYDRLNLSGRFSISGEWTQV